MPKLKTLPMPPHFDVNKASDENFQPNIPNLLNLAAEWRKTHNIKRTAGPKIRVLDIDDQSDFCFPSGSLYVGGRDGKGAINDTRRFSTWLYANLASIYDIDSSFDTHFPFQIFFTSLWIDAATGKHPDPMVTTITSQSLREGQYRPDPLVAHCLCNGNYTWLVNYVRHYVETLEKDGKYPLILWNFHTMLGTKGHNLVGLVSEAILFHAFVHGMQPGVEIKGGNPFSENYGILRPEVMQTHEGKSNGGQMNSRILANIIDSDIYVIRGQAASHCVKSTLLQIIDDILAHDPNLAKKIYVMEDCMSSVVVPGVVDFTPETEKAFANYKDKGLHVVCSTDSIESWPDVKL